MKFKDIIEQELGLFARFSRSEEDREMIELLFDASE